MLSPVLFSLYPTLRCHVEEHFVVFPGDGFVRSNDYGNVETSVNLGFQ